GRSGSRGERDRGLLHRDRLEVKVGPPDATKPRRPRAASLKFWPGSAASPASESDGTTVATSRSQGQRDPVFNLTGQGYSRSGNFNLYLPCSFSLSSRPFPS